MKLEGAADKAWISPAGISHVGEYHTEIAEVLFPYAENAEYSLEHLTI